MLDSDLNVDLPVPPLKVLTVNLTFRLEAPGELPRWKGALLRGGLGRALKISQCHPQCVWHDEKRESCPRSLNCAYHTVFEPFMAEDGDNSPVDESLGRARDVSRPYVVCPPIEEPRATTLHEAGKEVPFGLVLVGSSIQYLTQVVLAFHTLGLLGLGKSLIPARLVRLEALNPLSGQVMQIPAVPSPFMPELSRFILTAEQVFGVATALPSTLLLRFHTPMRLKYQGQYLDHPLPYALARAAADRLTQLCAHFGDGPWDTPFAPLVEGWKSATARRAGLIGRASQPLLVSA